MNNNFNSWKTHFSNNCQHLNQINWCEGYWLTTKEKSLIRSSIQQFQRGENSEGKHLYKFAQEFSEKKKDNSYLESIVLFIKEEQKHALVLGKFMQLQEIPRIQSHWVDQIFRKIRKIFNHENSILILTTAEIISAVYYQALGQATNSKLLKSICHQILMDEAYHLQFQSQTISALTSNHSPIIRWMSKTYHRLLLEGTIQLVWSGHQSVIQAGGFSKKRFRANCITEFMRVYHTVLATQLEKKLQLTRTSQINPRHYVIESH